LDQTDSTDLVDVLADLPEGWHWRRLGDLVDRSRGICYGIVQPGRHDPNGVPMINSKDVFDGGIASNVEFRVSSEIHRKYKRSAIQGGEVLLTLVGANFGQAAVAPDRGWLDTTVHDLLG
jgi:type I restriction enzyme S subunit